MILWSGGQSSQASWKPDHFVPILNVASSECIIEDGNDATDDGHDNVSQQRETPIKRSPPVAYRSPCSLISDDGRNDEVPEVTCSSDSRVRNIREGFLDARETFEILRTVRTSKDRFEEVPPGVKNNVGFPINYSANLQRKANGTRGHDWDDCGVWHGSSVKTNVSHHIIDETGTLISVVKRNGFYYRSKRHTEPMTLQPEDDDVLILRRMYMSLKRDPSYKKRIDWFLKGGKESDMFYSTAFVQYVGRYPLRWSLFTVTSELVTVCIIERSQRQCR